MAWIESHQELRNHPKLYAVCRTLAAKRSHMAGHLHFLWWWCMDYAIDGDLTKYTDGQIADAAEWDEDPVKFVQALVLAGFIDRDETSTKIHDWLDFCGEIVLKRLHRNDARRQKTAAIVSRNPPKSAETPPTVPYHTVPNQTKEKGDISRARINNIQANTFHPPSHTTTIKNPQIMNFNSNGFKPPTNSQVKDYVAAMKIAIDPEQFFDHYESNGWMIGKVKMQDWKAAVRKWAKNDYNDGKNKPANQETWVDKSVREFEEAKARRENDKTGNTKPK